MEKEPDSLNTFTAGLQLDVSGIVPASGVAAFLATPTSANLATAMTNETGTGVLVFATSPTLVTPTLGAATATTINKVAFTAPANGATLVIADGVTATVAATGTLVTTTGAQALTAGLFWPPRLQ